MQMLAAAVSMPAHARVNNKCWPVWKDSAKSDLSVVWNGRTYDNPFSATVQFNAEPSGVGDTCRVDNCVQRLFCTDSGAVGWYEFKTDGSSAGAYDVPLHVTWLDHPETVYDTKLGYWNYSAGGYGLTTYGPGTLTVIGNTVYFYLFNSGSYDSLL